MAAQVRRMADLVIGSAPVRLFQLRQDDVPVPISGYTIKGRLQVASDDAIALLEITAALTTPAEGKFTFAFPALTALNTGGRSDSRLWRILVWVAGADVSGPPTEIIERIVAIR